MSSKDSAPSSISAVTVSMAEFFSALPSSCSRILVALSGGPDSIAVLVSAVNEATVRRSEGFNLGIVACWVNHGIRPVEELESEQRFVQNLCTRLGVALMIQTIARGDITLAATAEGGVEAAARRFRYEALERACDLSECDIILMGHNGDDFLETMIMRFCSGAGTAGLRGIPRATGRVQRPLLGVPKSEILSYLGSLDQPFCIDSTNETDDYLRNRIRHDVLPVLFTVFPSLRTSLATVAAKTTIDEEALTGFSEELLVTNECLKASRTERCIDATIFNEAPLAVRMRALYRLCIERGASRIPWKLVLAAATSKKTAGRLASGAGLQFIRDGERIFIDPAHGDHHARSRQDETDAMLGTLAGFSIHVTGTGTYRIGKAGTCTVYSSERTQGLRLDAFSWPLWIRSRRAGDSIKTLGGFKMVDSLISELRIPSTDRGLIAIVEDVNGIVAVLGSLCGSRDVYRRNDNLTLVPAPGFLVIDLKGATFTDAV